MPRQAVVHSQIDPITWLIINGLAECVLLRISTEHSVGSIHPIVQDSVALRRAGRRAGSLRAFLILSD